jgi:hypothetical protein
LSRLRGFATLAIAAAGLWLLWSQYLDLARLSWWYNSTNVLQAAPVNPDYDLTTLPWQTVHPRIFELREGALTLTTSDEPYGYQAFATIRANGAHTAGIKFDADVERGGVTIGIQQGGEWIAINSSQSTGPFSGLNSALLGFRRSLMVTIANRNAAGESRVTIKSLRLYLRR